VLIAFPLCVFQTLLNDFDLARRPRAEAVVEEEFAGVVEGVRRRFARSEPEVE
jgi:hypothetical protein